MKIRDQRWKRVIVGEIIRRKKEDDRSLPLCPCVSLLFVCGTVKLKNRAFDHLLDTLLVQLYYLTIKLWTRELLTDLGNIRICTNSYVGVINVLEQEPRYGAVSLSKENSNHARNLSR
jgi:hypothetical protein